MVYRFLILGTSLFLSFVTHADQHNTTPNSTNTRWLHNQKVADQIFQIFNRIVQACNDPDGLRAERLATDFVEKGRPVALELKGRTKVFDNRLENFMKFATLHGKQAQLLNDFLKKHPEITDNARRMDWSNHSVYDLSNYPDAPPELKGFIIKAKRMGFDGIEHQLSRVITTRAMKHINRNGTLKHVVFPKKWFHLTPSGNRIVIVEKMDLVSDEKNEQAWQHISQEQLDELFYVIYELGLTDFKKENIYFTKDGKMAFIDTDISAVSGGTLKKAQPKKELIHSTVYYMVVSSSENICRKAKSDALSQFCSKKTSEQEEIIAQKYSEKKAELNSANSNEYLPDLVEHLVVLAKKIREDNHEKEQGSTLKHWDRGSENN